MYKLVAIDLDDTLLTDNLEVTPGTKAALEQAMSRGVVVTIATGRMYASAKQTAERIGLEVPLITYQGALIKHAKDGTVLYERYVPADVVAHIFDYAENHGLHLQAYYNDELIAKHENDKLTAYSKLSNIPYTIEPDFAKLADKPFPKLLMIDEPERLDAVMSELKASLGDRAHITKSKPNFLEIMHPEGTKGHALKHLADHFGCSMDQTIGIGDSWNDRELLERAGLGVAMGNAVPALKEIADYITHDNNDEGVRHVVEKFVLEVE